MICGDFTANVAQCLSGMQQQRLPQCQAGTYHSIRETVTDEFSQNTLSGNIPIWKEGLQQPSSAQALLPVLFCSPDPTWPPTSSRQPPWGVRGPGLPTLPGSGSGAHSQRSPSHTVPPAPCTDWWLLPTSIGRSWTQRLGGISRLAESCWGRDLRQHASWGCKPLSDPGPAHAQRASYLTGSMTLPRPRTLVLWQIMEQSEKRINTLVACSLVLHSWSGRWLVTSAFPKWEMEVQIDRNTVPGHTPDQQLG